MRTGGRNTFLTFNRLKWGSFAHSVVYVGLLITALADVLPELKTVLGWAHGVGWIVMTLAALAAVRLRVIPLRLAVAIAVLGGVGPFFGTLEFLRLQRRARRANQRGMVDVAWQ
ncbi:MAG: hypothetical protein MSC31_00175 [Solirubrobacteraceae bacterium MAG38_C4-C5]|nr:hypothetical protein [Candidatus Siliceabacter maunaloa]